LTGHVGDFLQLALFDLKAIWGDCQYESPKTTSFTVVSELLTIISSWHLKSKKKAASKMLLVKDLCTNL